LDKQLERAARAGLMIGFCHCLPLRTAAP
jgi:hypothetical protein